MLGEGSEMFYPHCPILGKSQILEVVQAGNTTPFI